MFATRAGLGWIVCLAAVLMFATASRAQEELQTPGGSEFAGPETNSFLDEAIVTDADEFLAEPLPEWGGWRARLGIMLLNRTSPAAMDFSNLLYPSSFNATDFNFPISVAPDISLRRPGARYDLDFRYFAANSIAQLPTRTIQLPWYSVPPTFTGSGALKSTLQSAEFNLRWPVGPNIAQLVGFRYLQFREKMIVAEETDFGSSQSIDSYKTSGRNEMFGLQIGNEIRWLYYGRFQLQSDVKVGIFGNAASASQTRTHNPSGPLYNYSYDYSRAGQRAALSFVGDVNLTATWQIRKNLALRGGYQVLILTGTANAPDQAEANYWWPTVVNTSGAVVYHDAMTGLEWSW